MLVSSGESILVDVGTTAAAFAAALVARSDLTEVTVITNGITIALACEAAYPRFSIVVTGGTLRPKQHSLVDPLAGAMLQTLSVDTVFLGCNGVHAEAGVTNINLPEAEIKRRMIGASQRCVVLADSLQVRHQGARPGVRDRRHRRPRHRFERRRERHRGAQSTGGRRHRRLTTMTTTLVENRPGFCPAGTSPHAVRVGGNH